MKKEKMQVYDGLNIILQYIKKSAIYGACGKSPVWFSQRYNQSFNRYKPYKFNEYDIQLLNDSMNKIVESLESIHLSSITNREQFISTFVSLHEILKPSYLRDDILKCSKVYWANRILKNVETNNTYRFSSEEIERMNEGIHKAALKISTIELIPS